MQSQSERAGKRTESHPGDENNSHGKCFDRTSAIQNGADNTVKKDPDWQRLFW